MASGGIVGTGLGQGSPGLIPFAETDFIFAAIGEELGLLGTTAILLLYLVLVGKGLRVALRAPDGFSTLLAVGLSTLVALQAFVIVGGVTRIIPLTGVTLPFVSYGGFEPRVELRPARRSSCASRAGHSRRGSGPCAEVRPRWSGRSVASASPCWCCS